MAPYTHIDVDVHQRASHVLQTRAVEEYFHSVVRQRRHIITDVYETQKSSESDLAAGEQTSIQTHTHTRTRHLSGFAGELKLIVSKGAIQLQSRVLLQGYHDRINENNIREFHSLHVLPRKGITLRKLSCVGISNYSAD